MRVGAVAVLVVGLLGRASPLWASPASDEPAAAQPADERDAAPAAAPAAAQPADERLTAAAVAAAPRPADSSGVAVSNGDQRQSPWLWIPRALLLPPRLVLEVAAAPVRGTLYAVDRYGVVARIKMLMEGPSRVAVQPLIKADSDFGVHLGARFTVRDLGGHGETLRMQVGKGGLYKQFFGFRLDSGAGLGGARVRYELELENQGRARFAGIGNGDITELGAAPLPIDPLRDDSAVLTRFSQHVVRNQLDLTLAIAEGLSLRASGAHLWRKLGDTVDDRAVDTPTVYDRDQLIGFDTGLSTFYGEALAELDRRQRYRDPLAITVPNRGWLAQAFLGYAYGLGVDPSSYARFGGDVQRFLELWGRDRILAMRLYAEGISAPVDEVPFVDLPSLGGSRLLRGYRSQRFRGQYLAVAQAEYHWAIAQNLSSFLLFDVGRVYRDAHDLSASDLRISYGAGLLLHTGVSYLGRLFAAGSPDGGLLYLSVSPVFETKDRTERY